MAKTFEFRRHSIKDGPTSAMIGRQGCALARAVGARQLRGRKFTDYFVSGLFRTHQTLAAFAEGAGDFRLKYMPQVPPIYDPKADVLALWDHCRQAEKRGEDMVVAARTRDEARFDALCAGFAGLFTDWVATMPEGCDVLIVGHSPQIEMTALGLFDSDVRGLRECEGVRIKFENFKMLEYATSDLDPRRIREALFP